MTSTPDEFARKTLIGLLSQQRVAEAQALADQLSDRYPKHSLAWKVKGVLALQQARFEDAIKLLQKASALAPKDWEVFNSLGLAFKGVGKVKNAEAAYTQALRLQPEYTSAYANLGDLLREQGRLDEALKTYLKLLTLTPDNEEVQHHVAALSGTLTPSAPAGYVRQVFDHYAERFDQHLTQQLQYKVPQDLADIYGALEERAPSPHCLDLGCGTGLMAKAMSKEAGIWTGIDLSTKMLEKAREKGLYQSLICSDVVGAMRSMDARSFDVVCAADVFIYVGALEDTFKEVHRILRPGGYFLFSVESNTTTSDFTLCTSGRFAHQESYIRRLAQPEAWRICSVRATAIRVERSCHLSGQLFALQRLGSAA